MFCKFMFALLPILGTHAMDRDLIIKKPYDRDLFETNFVATTQLPQLVWDKIIGYISDEQDLVKISEVNKSLNTIAVPKLRKFFIMDSDIIKNPYDRDLFKTNFIATTQLPQLVWHKIVGYLTGVKDLVKVSDVNKSLNTIVVPKLKMLFINEYNFRSAQKICTYNPVKSRKEKFEEIYGYGTTHVIFSFPTGLKGYGIDYVVGFVSSEDLLKTFKKIYPQVQGKNHAAFLVDINNTINLY